MFSETALKIYTLKKLGMIKSRSQFWKLYPNEKAIIETNINTTETEKELKEKKYNLTCAFDNDFPIIENGVKSADKPYLLAYRGDLTLIKFQPRSVAIVGTLYPSQDIVNRETAITKFLSNQGIIIISGLAKGCDTVAHKVCMSQNGKTVAILPSTFENIYPKENIRLSNLIIRNGGLVITEYIEEPKNKYDNIGRFIERDRLQAMFSNYLILISSCRHGEGDSGSRHAINKAIEYGKKRFIMYNENTDKDDPQFGLNKDFIYKGEKALTRKNIREIIE